MKAVIIKLSGKYSVKIEQGAESFSINYYWEDEKEALKLAKKINKMIRETLIDYENYKLFKRFSCADQSIDLYLH